MEIKSRMTSSNRIKEVVSKLKQEARDELKDLRAAVTGGLTDARSKVEVLLAAERKLYARLTQLEAQVASQTGVGADIERLTEEVEELAVNQVLHETVLKEDILHQIEETWDVLRGSLEEEFGSELEAARDEMEGNLAEVMKVMDDSAAGFNEDMQRQLTQLVEQRSEDLMTLQAVAEEAVRRCDAGDQATRSVQNELEEALLAITEAAEQQSSDLAQVRDAQEFLAARVDELADEAGGSQKFMANLHASQRGFAEETRQALSEDSAAINALAATVEGMRSQVAATQEQLGGVVESATQREAASQQTFVDLRSAMEEALSDRPTSKAVAGTVDERVSALEADLVLAAEVSAAEANEGVRALSETVASMHTEVLSVKEKQAETATAAAAAVERAEVTAGWAAGLEDVQHRLGSLEADMSARAEQDQTAMADKEVTAGLAAGLEDVQHRLGSLEADMSARAEQDQTAMADKERTQDSDTLAMITAELQQLKAALAALPAPSDQESGGLVDDRLAAMEADTKLAEELLRTELSDIGERLEALSHTVSEHPNIPEGGAAVEELAGRVDGLTDAVAELTQHMKDGKLARDQAGEEIEPTVLARMRSAEGRQQDATVDTKLSEELLQIELDAVREELQAAVAGIATIKALVDQQTVPALGDGGSEEETAQLAARVESLSQRHRETTESIAATSSVLERRMDDMAVDTKLSEELLRAELDAVREELRVAVAAVAAVQASMEEGSFRPADAKPEDRSAEALARVAERMESLSQRHAATTESIAAASGNLERGLEDATVDAVMSEEMLRIELDSVKEELQATVAAVQTRMDQLQQGLRLMEERHSDREGGAINTDVQQLEAATALGGGSAGDTAREHDVGKMQEKVTALASAVEELQMGHRTVVEQLLSASAATKSLVEAQSQLDELLAWKAKVEEEEAAMAVTTPTSEHDWRQELNGLLDEHLQSLSTTVNTVRQELSMRIDDAAVQAKSAASAEAQKIADRLSAELSDLAVDLKLSEEIGLVEVDEMAARLADVSSPAPTTETSGALQAAAAPPSVSSGLQAGLDSLNAVVSGLQGDVAVVHRRQEELLDAGVTVEMKVEAAHAEMQKAVAEVKAKVDSLSSEDTHTGPGVRAEMTVLAEGIEALKQATGALAEGSQAMGSRMDAQEGALLSLKKELEPVLEEGNSRHQDSGLEEVRRQLSDWQSTWQVTAQATDELQGLLEAASSRLSLVEDDTTGLAARLQSLALTVSEQQSGSAGTGLETEQGASEKLEAGLADLRTRLEAQEADTSALEAKLKETCVQLEATVTELTTRVEAGDGGAAASAWEAKLTDASVKLEASLADLRTQVEAGEAGAAASAARLVDSLSQVKLASCQYRD